MGARCGLLGQTLAHSYSPAIHKAFGSYAYDLYETEPEGLADFLQTTFIESDFVGLNVTIPYKQKIMAFCQELSPAAKAIGSVNTLLPLPGGGLYGDNTDAAGFMVMLSAMEQANGVGVAGNKVLVLGSGGSSRTVCYVLEQQSVGEIVVISRNGPNSYDHLNKHDDAAIIVNTTPVGMYPDTEKSPLNLALFSCLEGVLDLVYNPARTRLLMEAEIRNVPCLGGLIMLVEQAAAASTLFSGKTIGAETRQSILHRLRCRMENVVLIGMPGCGKSTVGRILAEAMGRPFIDTDEALEEITRCSIPEIFEREGEAGFRALETAVLKQWGKQSGLVIATGGGCVTQEENYYYLRQNGAVIFLERELHLLERKGRPLSKGDMHIMYARRLPLYRRIADRTVQNNAEPIVVAKKILEMLS